MLKFEEIKKKNLKIWLEQKKMSSSKPSPLSNTIKNLSDSELKNVKETYLLTLVENIKWDKERITYLKKMIDIFKLPDCFDEESGGCAIWKKVMFENIKMCVKVKDECVNVKCLDNKNCCTFVYVSVDFDAKKSICYDKLSHFSEYIIIDPAKKIVKARGDSFEMCVTLLSIFTSIARDKVSVDVALKSNSELKAIEYIKAVLDKNLSEDFKKILNNLRNNIMHS